MAIAALLNNQANKEKVFAFINNVTGIRPSRARQDESSNRRVMASGTTYSLAGGSTRSSKLPPHSSRRTSKAL